MQFAVCLLLKGSDYWIFQIRMHTHQFHAG